jgi:hypothetical protein
MLQLLFIGIKDFVHATHPEIENKKYRECCIYSYPLKSFYQSELNSMHRAYTLLCIIILIIVLSLILGHNGQKI